MGKGKKKVLIGGWKYFNGLWKNLLGEGKSFDRYMKKFQWISKQVLMAEWKRFNEWIKRF